MALSFFSSVYTRYRCSLELFIGKALGDRTNFQMTFLVGRFSFRASSNSKEISTNSKSKDPFSGFATNCKRYLAARTQTRRTRKLRNDWFIRERTRRISLIPKFRNTVTHLRADVHHSMYVHYYASECRCVMRICARCYTLIVCVCVYGCIVCARASSREILFDYSGAKL